jgi:hypothetical protein
LKGYVFMTSFKPLKAVVSLTVFVLIFATAIHSVNAAMPPKADIAPHEIIVNGRPIFAPTPFVCETYGIIMLPLRFVAEALGLVVDWYCTERRIDIGGVYSIWIDRFAISRDGRQTFYKFYPAPVIIEGRTFVPISFFYYGMRRINAEVDANIVTIERQYAGWSVVEIPDLEMNLWAYPLGFSERMALDLSVEYKTLYDVFYHETGGGFAIWTDATIYNFELIEVGLRNTGTEMFYFYPGRTLHTISEFTSDRPFAVRTHFGTMPRIAVTFLDEQGVRRYFTIQQSGMDGSILLIPFPLDEPNPF